MKNYNHILHKATTLLLTAAAALSLCLLTGCNRVDLPETGKYNVSVQLDTKTIDPSEVGSIVIYAFADTDGSGNEKLVGYLNEKVSDTDTDGIFNMTLWSRGEDGYVDFYVLLNYDSDGFKICDTNGEDVNFNAQTYSPHDIQRWTVLRRNPDNVPSDVSTWKVPMSNLEEKTQPTGGSPEPNRRFYLEDIKGWQVIPIEVTRAVSKVEVWFWSNDNLPESNTGFNQNHQYTAINNMILTDPVNITEVFLPQGENADDYIDAENQKTATNNTSYNGLTGGRFKPYTSGAFYSEEYFRLIWEQYILPNTFDGTTTLDVSYAHYFWDGWGWHGKTDYEKTKTIELPYGPRNTKIIVWCQLNDNIDRSFTYTVVDWDEETIDIPAFD